ncbi:MAG: DUF6568 family protein [Bacilli bacterium]
MTLNKSKKISKDTIIKYLELLVILIVTVVVIIGIKTWYHNDQEYKKGIPVIEGTLSEIKYEELDNYLLESASSNTIVFYIGVASDSNCRKFERDFKKYIKEQGLEEKITYLNLSNAKDINLVIKEINDKYKFKDAVFKYPALVLFKNGKIESTISGKENSYLNIEEAKEFLTTYKIKGTK